jgi:hypothetical protein
VPKEKVSIEHHPLIAENAQYKAFVAALNRNKLLTKDNYIRTINLKIYDSKNQRTPEALKYINQTGEFVIDNKKLEREPTHNDSIISENLDQTEAGNYSGVELMKIYKSFDDEDEQINEISPNKRPCLEKCSEF